MAWGSVAPGADLSGLTLSLAFLCYTPEKIDTRCEGRGTTGEGARRPAWQIVEIFFCRIHPRRKK
jgi:hypothetical protein